MTLLPKSGSRWRHYAAEVVTIVIGILLALAADAGRRYLADRATEQDILASLRVEFAADVRELDADQENRIRKLADIDLLSAVRKGTAEAPPPDRLAQALLGTLDYRFYTASHPVLDDLLATGQLELIRSDELRHALMVFGAARSRVGVVEQREREFVASQFEPYLAARLDLEALSSDSPDEVAAALSPAAGVLAERNFGSLLYLDRNRTNSSSGFAELLLNAVSEVRRILGSAD